MITAAPGRGTIETVLMYKVDVLGDAPWVGREGGGVGTHHGQGTRGLRAGARAKVKQE